jgi:TonB family protein
MWLSMLVSGMAWGADDPGLAPPADAPPVDVPAPRVGPSLPVPDQIVAAIYPTRALAEGAEGRVVLQLDIDAEGRVVDAFVVEGAGLGFDESALAASAEWRFLPALDEKSRPVPATIQYAYNFVAATAPVLSLEGVVREAGSRSAIGEATVNLAGPNGAVRTLRVGENGTFQAADLAEGEWSVLVTGPGLAPTEATLTVERGKVAQAVLYAEVARPWEAAAADEEIEVVGRYAAPEITERVLSADEIRYLPGSNGDVVKAIQNLPGVARPPLGIGQLIIRGTAPEDSAYFVDGISIPLAFHFAGLSTVVPSEAIEEVAFLPGNYGVRYGRVIGGVVDIRTTSELPTAPTGLVAVDLFQAQLFAEQRVSKRTAISVGARRSYADAILNPVLNGMEGVNIRAPRYYDLQARVMHETPSEGRLDLLFLLSDDRFRVVGGTEDATAEDGEEEEEKAAIGLTQAFRRLRVRFTQPLGNGWRSETAAGFGPSVQTFEFGGNGEAFEREWAVDLRQEVYRPVQQGQVFGWRFGLDARTDRASFLYDIPAFGTSQAEEGAGWRWRPAVYAEPTLSVGRFELIPGVRADAQILGEHRAFWVDPRFAAKMRASDSTRLKLSVGRYSQPPLPRQVLEGGGGTPGLDPTWSLQTSIGVDQRIAPGVNLELNRFYNWLGDVVVGREDAFRFFTGPPPIGPFDTDPWGNEGKGRIAGIEASLRAATDRVVALASATVSHSVRLDRAGKERLFTFDQPIVLNALGSYQLPKGWRLGARARFSSGNPYTPVVNRVFDHDARAFVPVYGERDSERLPAFWALDVRIDKEWVFNRWTLNFYLDVQNATNNQNVEVMAWTYDYRREDPTTQLPVLPVFGLKASW